MKDGGVALMSNGFGEGEGRVRQAIEDALNSPLLNNNDVFNAKKILFNVSFGEEAELRMEEMNDVHDFMSRFGRDIEVIWGTAIDNTLGTKVKMTILATGFRYGRHSSDRRKASDRARPHDRRGTAPGRRTPEQGTCRKRPDRQILRSFRPAYAPCGSPMRKAVVLNQDELDDDALIAPDRR